MKCNINIDGITLLCALFLLTFLIRFSPMLMLIHLLWLCIIKYSLYENIIIYISLLLWVESNLSTLSPMFQIYGITNNGIISFCTNAWVCPGCGPRCGVIGVGNAYPSPHDSIAFEPLCPYLAIMGISPERGTPGTEDKIRRCHPWKHKLLDISSQFRPECLLWLSGAVCAGQGLWSRCSLGT